MSYAPSFGAPGGHSCNVVAQGLKKHELTAKFAQEHVASEVRMHFRTLRCQTDRNTTSRFKIDI
jgi:hypothetical protein